MNANNACPFVTFELCTLEAARQRYVLYTFAPHWQVKHYRAALAEGAEAIAHVPRSEKLESIFLFSEWELFAAVSLLVEARTLFADPNNERFVFTSAVGLSGLARPLVRDVLGIMHFYFSRSLNFGFYATLDEALDAMRERVTARAAAIPK